MGSTTNRGPHCQLRDPESIRDGTMCRSPSPLPGRIGGPRGLATTTVAECAENVTATVGGDACEVEAVRYAIKRASSPQGHASDVFYQFGHIVMKVKCRTPTLRTLMGKYPDLNQAMQQMNSMFPGQDPYEYKYVEFGPYMSAPESDTAVGRFAESIWEVLKRIPSVVVPMAGQVIIMPAPKLQTPLKRMFTHYGEDMEGNHPQDSSAFPTLAGIVRNLYQAVVQDPGKVMQLDYVRGEQILDTAKEIQQLCEKGLYRYAASDSLVGLPYTTMNQSVRVRNCWGFVTDCLDGL